MATVRTTHVGAYVELDPANAVRVTHLGAYVELIAVAGTAPDAPSDLVATAVSADEIGLTWTDNSADEDNFELQRDTVDTFDSPATTTEPAANATSASATGLAASTLYYFRIRAVNAFGNSAYSNTASATTDAEATALPVLMGGGLFGGLQSISGGIG